MKGGGGCLRFIIVKNGTCMMVRKEEQMPEETKTDPHAECGMNTADRKSVV